MGLFRTSPKSKSVIKTKGIKIFSIDHFTPIGLHVWVKALINGKERLIKKPTNGIPKDLLSVFGDKGGAG